MFLNLSSKKSLFDSTFSLYPPLFFLQVRLFPFTDNLFTVKTPKFKGHFPLHNYSVSKPDVTLSSSRKFVQTFENVIPLG